MDWKERFKIEYYELEERVNKLNHMLKKYMNNELDFTPNCSFELLHTQLVYMQGYLYILQERARIEEIEL